MSDDLMAHMVLPHGDVNLPAFFPDGTQGVVRCVDTVDLEGCGIPGIVMNAYHLLSAPGVSVLKAAGGLHGLTGWKRPILTDSGGFQVFSLIQENPKYGVIRKNEIVFYPENSGKKVIFTPEKCIQSQFAYGSDIMMCLDYCTRPDDTDEVNEKAVDITVDWAIRCKEEYLRQLKSRKLEDGVRPLLFAIIQGGGSKELRRKCADELIKIGFDGYGYGGWPLDKDGRLVEDILRCTAELMPDETPKYAMGLGKPEGIVACREMGYNLFDCVIPTREARHNRLYVFTAESEAGIDVHTPDFYQYHYIMDDKYMKDMRPVSESCDCHLCKNYSRAYLRHLYKVGDSLGYRLATIHNLRFYTMLMEKLRAQDHGA
jgi:queuine tRNA-ribosyltransferase